MGLFDDFTPSELSQFWQDQLAAAEDKKPKDAKEAEPESYKVFLGDVWAFAKKRPDQYSSVNIIFAAFKGFLPQVLADMPKPSAMSLRGNDAYANLHNNLKSLRDRELGARAHFRDAVQEAFLRGTGAVRHDRDTRRGMARTRYISVRDLFWDSHCCHPDEAKHLIERHVCSRWEFAQKFGPDIAQDIKAHEESPSGVSRDRISPFDTIEYYLAWSKHGDERRLYAFHKEWNDTFLIEEAGRPGEPWPFDFDDEEWHISPLWFQRESTKPWGFSYYEVTKGPIQFSQFAFSYILSAMRKASQQSVLYPRSFGQVAQKLADATKHLEFIDYDPDDLAGVSPRDAVQVIQYPPMNPELGQAFQMAKGAFEEVSGFNAMTMMNPGSVETASESVRMTQQAENRMADDQHSVEEWTDKCWRKEIQIDCRYTPTRSVVRVIMAPEAGPAIDNLGETDEAAGSYAQVVETSQTVEYPPESLLTDVPYPMAILLEQGVGDPQAAARQMQAFNQLQAASISAMHAGMQPPQAPPLDPRIAARQQFGVPLEAKIEILEPGMEAFVGQLAQAWIEDMTPRQIKAELEIRTQRGSSQRIGHMQQWQEAMQVFSTLYPIYQARGDYQGMALLENFLSKSMENYDLDGLQRSPQQLMQMVQQMMMQQQQAQQQAQAQEQSQRDQERADKQSQFEAKRADAKQTELGRRQDKARSEGNRERESRAKNLQSLINAQVRQGSRAA